MLLVLFPSQSSNFIFFKNTNTNGTRNSIDHSANVHLNSRELQLRASHTYMYQIHMEMGLPVVLCNQYAPIVDKNYPPLAEIMDCCVMFCEQINATNTLARSGTL